MSLANGSFSLPCLFATRTFPSCCKNIVFGAQVELIPVKIKEKSKNPNLARSSMPRDKDQLSLFGVALDLAGTGR